MGVDCGEECLHKSFEDADAPLVPLVPLVPFIAQAVVLWWLLWCGKPLCPLELAVMSFAAIAGSECFLVPGDGLGSAPPPSSPKLWSGNARTKTVRFLMSKRHGKLKLGRVATTSHTPNTGKTVHVSLPLFPYRPLMLVRYHMHDWRKRLGLSGARSKARRLRSACTAAPMLLQHTLLSCNLSHVSVLL